MGENLGVLGHRKQNISAYLISWAATVGVNMKMKKDGRRTWRLEEIIKVNEGRMEMRM